MAAAAATTCGGNYGHHADEYTINPPKHDFPRFEGDAPNLWIDHTELWAPFAGVKMVRFLVHQQWCFQKFLIQQHLNL